jgi:2,4'-dihydroxyacetophenone dioxygenase
MTIASNVSTLMVDIDRVPWVERKQADLVTATKLLQVDLVNGTWVSAVRYPPGTVIGKHRHFTPVYGLTLAGRWHYAEYDWTATKDSLVYEAAGSEHTLVVDQEGDEHMVGVFVTGPLAFFNEDGSSMFRDVRQAYDEYWDGLRLMGEPWPANILGEYVPESP